MKITKRKDGRYMARIVTGTDPVTGEAKRKCIYGRTKKECQEKLRQVIADLDAGKFVEKDKVTCRAWLEAWIAGRKPYLAPESFRVMDSAIKNHLVPTFGQTRLVDLTTREVQLLISRLLEKGYKPGTVKQYYAFLNSALTQAKKEGFLRVNPCEAVELPRQRRKEIEVLTQSEIKTLLTAAQDGPNYAVILLALSTGLRLGEFLGLRWEDVDLTTGEVKVKQQNSRYGIKDLKTAKSRRTIHVPESVTRALKAHRAKQFETRLLLGLYGPANPFGWRDCGLVATTRSGGPVDPRNFFRQLTGLATRAGLRKVNPHMLRHTYATLALAAGVDLKTVSENLGHTTISMTADVYGHVTAGMRDTAAARIGEALEDCL